jgi:3-oxoacyl-[acyl-carrier protein] reductase
MSHATTTSCYDTAIVTGGAGTLGSAISLELAHLGYKRVAIVDFDVEKSRAVARSISGEVPGTEIVCVNEDLTDPATPAAIVGKLLEPGRRISCIVNNAAANRRGGAGEFARSDWDLVMSMNIGAPMYLCQAAIPHWRETGGGASVVNITSRAWLAGSGVAYSASKAGLVGLTHALSVELGPLGVRVNAVGPSYIESPFNGVVKTEEELRRIGEVQRRMTSLGRLGTARDVAHMVAFLASDKANFITGETIYVAGGAQLPPNANASRAYGL